MERLLRYDPQPDLLVKSFICQRAALVRPEAETSSTLVSIPGTPGLPTTLIFDHRAPQPRMYTDIVLPSGQRHVEKYPHLGLITLAGAASMRAASEGQPA